MTLFLAFLAGLAGAAVGYVAGAATGSTLADIFGMSNFEGAIGYFAVFVCGPLGALIGLVLGMWLVLRRRHSGFAAISGRMMLIVVGILAGAGIAIRLATLDNFQGISPQVEFEIRLPAAAKTPAEKRQVRIELQTGKQSNDGQLYDAWLRRDGDRAVLSGFVPLYVRTSQRTLVVTLPDTPALLFRMPQSATPKVSETYGAWMKVDFIDQPDASQARKPKPDENYEIRYRVPDWTKPYVQPEKSGG